MLSVVEEIAETQPSIADFLKLRPWKHALFTTYTLSLSYFESEILRPLLQAGCSDIWLIADAEGYRSSLLERRSMRVGQDYRLIPVALPAGVFHAKCIYLGSDDGDLLLVGSGNVTFGGHGKSREVFEVLSPNDNATAFADFAEFLEAVGSRPDILIANSDWIQDFAARSLRAAGQGHDTSDEPPPRLIHPLHRPIIDQLPDLLAPYGASKNVRIMSPYHDRDGFAVRELSKRVDAEKISVAVTGQSESPFPFQDAASWPNPPLPVRPQLEDQRFVHAKWYEFENELRTLLFTGSVNATRKALTTIDNVELGVVRFVSTDKGLQNWHSEPLPTFKPQSRMPSGLKGNEIVYAHFDLQEANKLSGRLISLSPSEGVWIGRLIGPDGDAVSFDVAVGSTGDFTVISESLLPFADTPALQIVLTLGEREARGWVQNEMLLSMSGRRRLTASALNRMIRREGLDDDIEALLDYLSIQADRHLRIFDKPLQKLSEDEAANPRSPGIVTINISDLAPVIDHGMAEHNAAGSSQPGDPFDAAMLRLRRMLLGQGRSKDASLGNQELDGDEDDPEKQAPHKAPGNPAKTLGLSAFEQQIDTLIDQTKSRPDSLRGLLSLSFEVGMWFRLYRLRDKDLAHEFLEKWFYRACKLSRPDKDSISSLQQHIFTAAAALMRLAERTGPAAILAAQLHNSLERYVAGPVDVNLAQRSLLPDDAGFAEPLLGEIAENELASSLVAVLAQRTSRQQLEDALTFAETDREIPGDWEIFQTGHGKALLTAFRSPDWQSGIQRATPGIMACSFDNYSFAPDEKSKFEHIRIGRCIHCKKFTLNMSP